MKIGNRTRKPLIAACLILLLFCLFTVVFHWRFDLRYAREESGAEIQRAYIEQLAEQLDNGNGAKYYLRAYQAIDGSMWGPSLSERYEDVWQNGWRQEEPELEEYLKKNEPALELVRQGNQQEFCSMPVDDSDYNLAYFAGFREIARIMCLKGEMLEWRGRHASAAQTYSDLLRFTTDFFDSGAVIHALVALAMEEIAYEGLEALIGGLDDESVCEGLLAEMIDIEAGRVPLGDIFEREFARDREYYEKSAEDIFYYSELYGWPRGVRYFASPILQSSRYLRYRLSKTRYLEETEEFGRYVIELSKRPYSEIFRENVKNKIPNNDLSQMVFNVTPHFLFFAAKSETDHRANIIRVALHLHLLRNGAYPESLELLTSSVPEELSIDPFSEKPFVYKKTGDGYLFYSLGRDLDDDGGNAGKPSRRNDYAGDIVFEPPKPTAADSQALRREDA